MVLDKTFILVFFCFVSTFSMSATQNTTATIFLGTVEGKGFFVEPVNSARTWTEAKNFCKESGLRLASITSLAQKEFLVNAVNDATFPESKRYWTAGRDSLKISQFAWDYNGETPDSSAVSLKHIHVDIHACLAYYTGNINDPAHYDAWLCSNSINTLCEAAIGNIPWSYLCAMYI